MYCNWNELNEIERNEIEMNWIEMNEIEMNEIEMNEIEMNWIDLEELRDFRFGRIAFHLYPAAVQQQNGHCSPLKQNKNKKQKTNNDNNK